MITSVRCCDLNGKISAEAKICQQGELMPQAPPCNPIPQNSQLLNFMMNFFDSNILVLSSCIAGNIDVNIIW